MVGFQKRKISQHSACRLFLVAHATNVETLGTMRKSAPHLKGCATIANSLGMSRTNVLIHAQLRVSLLRTLLGGSRLILLAAKQCYHCQGLGHVQADCPTLRISGGATAG